jgi:lipopolysaccharide transport system ATP-binding protein
MQDLSTGQGRTIIFVSHNMEAITNLCNCGFILQNGVMTHKLDEIKFVIKEYLHNDQQ